MNVHCLIREIVAGKYPQKVTIILSNRVHPGNSGGPVLEIEKNYQNNEINFRIIGVVTQFIPIYEVWENHFFSYKNSRISNSGYSIAVAMNYVIELLMQ